MEGPALKGQDRVASGVVRAVRLPRFAARCDPTAAALACFAGRAVGEALDKLRPGERRGR